MFRTRHGLAPEHPAEACCTVCGAPLAEGTGANHELTALGAAQTASENDQTLADGDQTASDSDQTAADRDQIASDADQESSDDDQGAADEDLAAGGDVATYRRGRLARKRSGRSRAAATTMREQSDLRRLTVAGERDTLAELRDREAADRDARASLYARHEGSVADPRDVLLRAATDRQRAAADRAAAAEDRAVAASDRREAARERADAEQTRAESADALARATTDELTGCWARRFGLEALERELARALRSGTSLALAFIDVDGLKNVNDGEGHLAGDAVLRQVGHTIRRNVRSYDVVVRYGGDEFVCGLSRVGVTEATQRLDKIVSTLHGIDIRHSISFGLAQASHEDDLGSLIARADAALIAKRGRRAGLSIRPGDLT